MGALGMETLKGCPNFPHNETTVLLNANLLFERLKTHLPINLVLKSPSAACASLHECAWYPRHAYLKI